MLGEMLVVLKIEYDSEKDMTRVGFDYARETDMSDFSLEGIEVVEANAH
jgi:hypothetical protein